MIFEKATAERVLEIADLELSLSSHPITPDIAKNIEAIGGWCAVDEKGAFAVAGILPRWDGYGVGWSWLGRRWRKYANVITDRVRFEIETHPYHRIEVGVRHGAGYENAVSWAYKLGLKMETERAEKWGPDQTDYSILVRVK